MHLPAGRQGIRNAASYAKAPAGKDCGEAFSNPLSLGKEKRKNQGSDRQEQEKS